MSKYLADGRVVKFIAKVNAGVLVAQVLDVGDGSYYTDTDHPILVDRVFDEAPTEKYTDKIKHHQKRIEALQQEKIELLQEVAHIKKINKERFEKYARYDQLKHIDDFIDGKITHYVFLNYSPEIVELKDAVGGYDKSSLKLLSLYGHSDGDLSWQLNQYRDGSGGNDTVIPCLSHFEALQYLQEYIESRVSEGNLNVFIIRAAKKHGIKINKEAMQEWNAAERKQIDKDIENYKQNIQILEVKKSKIGA